MTNNQKAVGNIRAALEEMHNPNVYSQALVDSRNMLNLSLETLLAHFQAWLWQPIEAPEYDVVDLMYVKELREIEEWLVRSNLIYQD